MPLVDETKGVYFKRPAPYVPHYPFSAEALPGPVVGPRHAGPLPAYGPDPRSGVAKERARLMREHPGVWER